MGVLVTGGAGYIGSHTVLDLLARGEQVVVIDNLSTGFAWAVDPRATLVVGDVGDKALVSRLLAEHGIDTIMHFAGSVVVPESVASPLAYYDNNTAKSRTLLACAIEAGVDRFIFSSTAAVYGNPEVVPVSETAAPWPLSPYGTSKLMTEIMLRDAARAHGLGFVSLRYFNVAGSDPEGRTGQSTAQATHLVKVACETALGKRSHMEIFGTDYDTPDGTCVRDYIHVSDLAAAHGAALQYLRAGGSSDVVNCGYARGHSVREVIAAVERAVGHTFEVRVSPRRPGDPACIVAATDRIRSRLDWAPRHADLDRIVTDALGWERHLDARRATLRSAA
jgi:UDP-glucose 4-epimerase